MSILYSPSIDAFYQISVHLGKRFQRRNFFRNQPIRNKNCLWWPCLLTDQDEMNNLYKGPSIDASYQVSAKLAKQFQGRIFFRNRPIRNKNCLWWPCLLTNRDEMSNFIENLPYMLSTKFQFIWDSVSEEKIFQKSTNQKQEWPVAAMFVNGSEINEQSLQRTFHTCRCFLPSFDSFGPAVSEGKIYQKSTNQKQKWPVAAMFVNRLGRNEQSLQKTFHRCFLPSFSSFG